MTEPVGLDIVQAHLRLTDDEVDAAYLGGLITAARRVCEIRTGRALVGRTAILKLDAFPARPAFTVPLEVADPRALEIVLPDGTVSSITSIAYRDDAGVSHTVDPAAYTADLAELPARVAPIGAWPVAGAGPGAVTVTYVLSPLSPDDLAVATQAMLLLIGNWDSNREGAVVDVRGVAAELPLAVSWLLSSLFQFSTE